MNKKKPKKSSRACSCAHSSRAYLKERPVNISVDKGGYFDRQELQWSAKEEKELQSRILALRDDQIAVLPHLVNIYFSKDDIENVVAEIRKNNRQSGHLPIIISEADSKESLLWWLDYFEKQNEKQKF